MSKKILFGQEAKSKLMDGIKKVSDAVGSTLGPKANNVAIDRAWGSPLVLHDGVSVAKEIDLEDQFENMGAQLIKEAAQKTNDMAGDGTTTATLLTAGIVAMALKNIAAGANAMLLRKGIEIAVDDLVDMLDSFAQPVDTQDKIKSVAVISAQDEKIGTLISNAIEKLGKESIIVVEESGETDITIDYKEGMNFDKGFISPYFITNPELGESALEEPMIVVTDTKITTVPQFASFMQNITALNNGAVPKSIFLIVGELSGNPLASFVVNKVKGVFNVCAVQAPNFGDKQKEILEDIVAVTGGTFISEAKGLSIDKMTLEDFGKAKRIIVTKDGTTIVDGGGDKKRIDSRIKELKNQLRSCENEFEREKLEERLAKLTSGIAVINVGANSEMEMKEKKERCIDAINATKAAISDGVVPGGETALLRAAYNLNEKNIDLISDVALGYKMVLSACGYPFEVLMDNSGFNDGQMREKLITAWEYDDKSNIGVDVMDGMLKNMVEAGIIDPVKVTKSALRNAASTAIMVFTTNTLISEVKEKKESDGFVG
jgi:chaperonin GroEL